MPDVKWIKVTVDMFENPKIRYLRTLPDGDRIVLFWVMLLTMAGRCNDGGRVYLADGIPYTPKMLTMETGLKEKVIKVALSELERIGMISVCDSHITVTGWAKHQNLEGMDKIREQNRDRKRKQRAMNRDVSRDTNVTSRDSHATDIEEEKEKEREGEEEIGGGGNRACVPTYDQILAYAETLDKENPFSPQFFQAVDVAWEFWSHYNRDGWMIGTEPVRDWKALFRTWRDNELDKRLRGSVRT